MATKKNKRPYPRFGQDFSGESKTQQHFTDGCDVNNIVQTYDRTGIDPFADRKAQEQYGDGMYRTFQDAQIVVAEVRSHFEELPLAIREQYSNDPELYLAAAEAQFNLDPGDNPSPEKDVSEDVSEALTDTPTEVEKSAD